MFNGALFFLGTCYDKLVCRFEALRFLRGWIMVTLRSRHERRGDVRGARARSGKRRREAPLRGELS
jgi:hypothetical protein